MADSWKAPNQRKWEASKIELEFEKLLSDNEFIVVGIKEYKTQTNYLIGKNEIFQEFTIYHTGKVSAKELFSGFLRFYDIRWQYEELKKKYEQENNL